MPPESEQISLSLRQDIAQRARHLCEYCQSPEAFSPDSFTIDHIYPRALGEKSITLALHRPGVVNLRKLLTSAGLHP